MSRYTAIRTCASGPTVRVDAAAACAVATPSDASPIDEYYDSNERTMLLGTPEAIAASPQLGRLLLLGHVSAVETYFRTVLVRLLAICPEARKHAGSAVIPLSSVYYYTGTDVTFGLFDGVSLAGLSEFKKALQKSTGYSIDGTAAVAALGAFDDLCHLRHAAVHAQGSVSSASAMALGVHVDARRFRVEIDFARAQEVAIVCRSAVQEVNQVLFEKTLAKWHTTRRLTGAYDEDRKTFEVLYRTFRSTRDPVSKNVRPKDAYEAIFAS